MKYICVVFSKFVNSIRHKIQLSYKKFKIICSLIFFNSMRVYNKCINHLTKVYNLKKYGCTYITQIIHLSFKKHIIYIYI